VISVLLVDMSSHPIFLVELALNPVIRTEGQKVNNWIMVSTDTILSVDRCHKSLAMTILPSQRSPTALEALSS
jgi:hypothetical protein